VFLGYSPFGVPDYKVYPPALPAANQLNDPVVVSIAARLGATPAQVILAWMWQLGIPTNPRSMNPQHMKDNLGAYGFSLNQTEMHLMSTRPQDFCSFDSTWYECA
jgi:diketogulonate reductase-like aldo/keto reductase